LEPDEAARFFDILCKKGRTEKTAPLAKSLLVDPDGLRRVLGDERYKCVYLASLKLGLYRVSRLFTDLPPKIKGIEGYHEEEEAEMEFVTLGERRSMSKGFVLDKLDRLLSDPDPVVIRNILDNPRITEREALKIASKRPNSPRILKLMACHRKWAKRYGVIKAIVLNPYSPPRISIALLDGLLTQDLRLVAGERTIHQQVTAAAEELLKERAGNGR
ncbi:MAG: hypothetical protein HZB21_06675, partial [Deltaproteobacteria bacterium]|nr:hypothetical protein [Deltaproteobacteria bacterium]